MNIEPLISSNMKFIRRLCDRYFSGKPEDAEMLNSEVLEKIWRHREKFNGTDLDFKKWCYIIVKRTFIDSYHKKSNKMECDIDSISVLRYDSGDILKDIENRESIACIEFTIRNIFGLEFMAVYKLVLVDGFQYDEAAVRLKIPIGTVKNRTYTIRRYISNKNNILNPKNKEINREQIFQNEGVENYSEGRMETKKHRQTIREELKKKGKQYNRIRG
jgi:RNA polymerase sigma factor (sigma-70 family)